MVYVMARAVMGIAIAMHSIKPAVICFCPEVRRRIMLGTYVLSAGYYDAFYKRAQQVRTLIRQDFNHAFAEVDVIAAPTSPNVAFTFGENSADPVAMYLQDVCYVACQPRRFAGYWCHVALIMVCRLDSSS
jgi:Asp-tRNA(Asn)/Glu-tRNA(Gln) amidotransferase A subunit family amidase